MTLAEDLNRQRAINAAKKQAYHAELAAKAAARREIIDAYALRYRPHIAAMVQQYDDAAIISNVEITSPPSDLGIVAVTFKLSLTPFMLRVYSGRDKQLRRMKRHWAFNDNYVLMCGICFEYLTNYNAESYTLAQVFYEKIFWIQEQGCVHLRATHT